MEKEDLFSEYKELVRGITYQEEVGRISDELEPTLPDISLTTVYCFVNWCHLAFQERSCLLKGHFFIRRIDNTLPL